MVLAYNPSTWDVVLGQSEVQGHPQLHRELEASMGYVRLCFKIIVGLFYLFSWAQNSYGITRYYIKDPVQPAVPSPLDPDGLESISQLPSHGLTVPSSAPSPAGEPILMSLRTQWGCPGPLVYHEESAPVYIANGWKGEQMCW